MISGPDRREPAYGLPLRPRCAAHPVDVNVAVVEGGHHAGVDAGADAAFAPPQQAQPGSEQAEHGDHVPAQADRGDRGQPGRAQVEGGDHTVPRNSVDEVDEEFETTRLGERSKNRRVNVSATRNWVYNFLHGAIRTKGRSTP
jgi:hypothetical protein